MRTGARRAFLGGLVGGLATLLALPSAASASSALPLSFEPNVGQTGEPVRFFARGPGFALFLTPTEAVLSLPAGSGRAAKTPSPERIVRMRFVGSRPDALLVGEYPGPGRSHYLVGRDPARWRTHVPHYGRVRARGLYPGVDVVYHGSAGRPEYDLAVAAGHDWKQIRLSFEGVDRISIDAGGDLLLRSGGAEIRQKIPRVRQVVGGETRTLAARFQVLGHGEVGFDVEGPVGIGPLVIDPVLSYSTYLGGAALDAGRRVAVDATGHAFVTGRTLSSDFPTSSPLQPVRAGAAHDAFVAKYDPTGSTLLYATYLGGSQDDWGHDIEVDASGSAYVSGLTVSSDFPTVRAFQPRPGGGIDAFVAKLDASGAALVYSTYLGGSGEDRALGLAVDAGDRVVAVGHTSSPDFPLRRALQPTFGGGTRDAFVAMLSASGSDLIFATYLGGGDDDVAVSVAARALGGPVLTGFTSSSDFPLVRALQPRKAGGHDAIVAGLLPDGSGLDFSTYLGGSGNGEPFDEIGADIATDALGNICLAGRTRSGDFPLRRALQPRLGGIEDAFVAVLEPGGGSLLFATYFGGSAADEARALAVGPGGEIAVTGRTASSDFPVLRGLQARPGGPPEDAFVSILGAAGDGLRFSDYLGGGDADAGFGVAVDRRGNVAVAGETLSADFPAVRALQGAPSGHYDGFVTRIVRAPEVVLRLRDSAGMTLLDLSLINGADEPRSMQIRMWAESTGIGFPLPLLGPASAALRLDPGASLDLLSGVVLSRRPFPFPGTTLAARLLDPTTGATLSESRCAEIPCH